MRGLAQVSGSALTRGMDAAIAGVSGLGHISLAAGMILLLWKVQAAAAGK